MLHQHIRLQSAKNMATREPPKPWSVSEFERFRPEIVEFVRKVRSEMPTHPRILVKADVKVGKREMVAYNAMLDAVQNAQHRVFHFVICALHRKADEDQRNELRQHNVEYISINNQTSAENAKACFREKAAMGRVVVHLDECDFGSGNEQLMSGLWKGFNTAENVFFILYSASHEEALVSNEGFFLMVFTPPATYRGAAAFLAHGLVTEAEPPLVRDNGVVRLGPQLASLIADAKAHVLAGGTRNVVVVRLSMSERGVRGGAHVSDKKDIYMFAKGTFPELEGCNVSIDKEDMPPHPQNNTPIQWNPDYTIEPIQWSRRSFWNRINRHIVYVVVMDQTSSRSTEWAFHDFIFATHDYRKPGRLTYSVVIQAQLRVAHYITKYKGFQPIRVCGSVDSFRLAAGEISINDYNPSLSQRIIVYRVPSTPRNVECTFIPCTPTTFRATFRATFPHRRHRIPFHEDHMENDLYQGNLRGMWRVRQYEELYNDRHWGNDGVRITPCYQNGVLGVAHRVPDLTNPREPVRTTEDRRYTTHRSMFVAHS